jgi:phosphoglycolate phosphatase
MHLASALIGIAATDCIYIGDDERDVISGRAAGMRTIVAGWGYLGSGSLPGAWGADAIVAAPHEILGFAAAKG